MFRSKQSFGCEIFTPVYVNQVSSSEEDVLVSTLVRADKLKPLPSVELFDLGKLIDAKVDLKQVNCKLIPTSKPSFDSFGTQADIEETKTNNDKKEGE